MTTTRSKLHLPGMEPVSNGTPAPADSPLIERVREEVQQVLAKPAKPAKPPYDPSTIREFCFLDGRPIAIHRHSVRFATPLKDDPEHATLVATKEGVHPLPLKITYTPFMAWWRAQNNEREPRS